MNVAKMKQRRYVCLHISSSRSDCVKLISTFIKSILLESSLLVDLDTGKRIIALVQRAVSHLVNSQRITTYSSNEVKIIKGQVYVIVRKQRGSLYNQS